VRRLLATSASPEVDELSPTFSDFAFDESTEVSFGVTGRSHRVQRATIVFDVKRPRATKKDSAEFHTVVTRTSHASPDRRQLSDASISLPAVDVEAHYALLLLNEQQLKGIERFVAAETSTRGRIEVDSIGVESNRRVAPIASQRLT
jgi:hypothetical protein